MLEIFQNFEHAMGGAAQSSPLVLAGMGIAVVLAGLCMWLGGLYIKKLVVGVIGGAVGSALGAIVIDRGPVPVAALAAVAALIAIAFERVFITIMAAVLATVVGFAVLAGPYMENTRASESENRDRASTETSAFGDGEVMAELRAYVADVGSRARYAGSNMPPQRWALVAVVAVICAVGGFAIWRPIGALFFSALGTMLIFFGMTLLLLYKGSSPVGLLNDRLLVYTGIFAGMIVFGTIEQLVLCRSPQAKAVKKKKIDDKEKEDTGTRKRGWHTT